MKDDSQQVPLNGRSSTSLPLCGTVTEGTQAKSKLLNRNNEGLSNVVIYNDSKITKKDEDGQNIDFDSVDSGNDETTHVESVYVNSDGALELQHKKQRKLYNLPKIDNEIAIWEDNFIGSREVIDSSRSDSSLDSSVSNVSSNSSPSNDSNSVDGPYYRSQIRGNIDEQEGLLSSGDENSSHFSRTGSKISHRFQTNNDCDKERKKNECCAEERKSTAYYSDPACLSPNGDNHGDRGGDDDDDDENCTTVVPKLDMSFIKQERLLDRHNEISKLHESFNRSLSPYSRPELILISGKSGTGKTVLARQLQKPAEALNGYYVRGKFDQLAKPEPYSAFVSAFTDIVRLILKKGEETVNTLKKLVLHRIESDVQLLVGVFPALKNILLKRSLMSLTTTKSDGGDGENEIKRVLGAEVESRLKYAVAKLVEAICIVGSSPLVLVLDDLQWADSASIDLLHALISNRKIGGLVVIGICRSNEVSYSHPLAVMLRQIEDEKTTTVSHNIVEGISSKSANKFVSAALHLSEDRCQPLTDVLIAKTNGNVLFFVQLLQTYCNDNVLLYNNKQQKWIWDESKLNDVEEKFRDVVDLFSRSIKALPDEAQAVLRTAACLGAEFDLKILSFLLSGTNISRALEVLIEKNFLIYDGQLKRYFFSHDRVQQATYSLILDEEKPLVHLTIGRKLQKSLSLKKSPNHIFLVVNQMVRGISLIKDQEEKYDLAGLCLVAGKNATLSSAFKVASVHFWQGISLLGKRRWREEYNMSLNLYSAAAQIEFCTADFEKMNVAIQEVLLNSRSVVDRFRVYSAKVYSLYSRGKLQESINVALDSLKLYGVNFPARISTAHIIKEILKTKCLLRGKSNADLLQITDMQDEKIQSAMGLMNHMIRYTFEVRENLYPLIATRLVQLSLKYGLCAISAFGFCAYAGVLLNLEDFNGGYEYAQLSLSILTKFQEGGGQWLGRVHTVVYAIACPWKDPIRSSLEPLLKALTKGMETGDIEFAAMAARHYCLLAWSAGVQLSHISEKLESQIDLMEKIKQETSLAASKLQLKMVNNFMLVPPKKNQPLPQRQHDNNCVDDENCVDKYDPTCLASRKRLHDLKDCSSFVGQHGIWKLILAYYYGDIDAAIEAAKTPQMDKGVVKMTILVVERYFYTGLVSVEAARRIIYTSSIRSQGSCIQCRRQKQRKMYLSQAKKSLKKLEKFARVSPKNCLHKLLILEAELADVMGGKMKRKDVDNIAMIYDRAIVLAKDEGFIRDQALACERASWFIRVRRNDEEQANEFFGHALRLYKQWGAKGKVAHMLRNSNSYDTCNIDFSDLDHCDGSHDDLVQ